MDQLRKTFEFKRKGGAEGEFFGYASTFGNVDSEGDIIARGAFQKHLPAFLQDGIIAWQHQWENPIGRPVEAYEDEMGLYLRATISDTSIGRDARTLINDGVVKKMSIGFQVKGSRDLTEEEAVELLGEVEYLRSVKDLPWWRESIREITEIRLFEVSPVSVPANPQAVILGAKSLRDGLSFAEHSEAVRDAVEGFLARTADLADMRKSSGRKLSAEKAALLECLHSGLSDTALKVRGVLDGLAMEPGLIDRDVILMDDILARARRRAAGA